MVRVPGGGVVVWPFGAWQEPPFLLFIPILLLASRIIVDSLTTLKVTQYSQLAHLDLPQNGLFHRRSVPQNILLIAAACSQGKLLVLGFPAIC